MAFCSEIPFICSRILRGLLRVRASLNDKSDPAYLEPDIRVSNRLDCVVAAIDDEGNISLCQAGDPLTCPSQWSLMNSLS